MRHCLDIDQFTTEDILAFIKRASYFKQQTSYPCYPHHPVALLFYENSTRTRISFELAAKKLSMPVIHFDGQHSSEQKGELIEDTVKTLMAMGIKQLVIRHSTDGLPAHLARIGGEHLAIINAGDGKHAHPSQALLDGMTILAQKPNPQQLKIAIVGDILHSRVANSLQHLCARLNVRELVGVAPKAWQPSSMLYGHMTSSLQEGLKDADVVICLRVQKERLLASEALDLAVYHRDYALTSKSIAFAKPDAMLMHPGPLNRGIEIDDEVADGPQSFILEQVSNGVFMRMAILEYVVGRSQ